MTETEQTTKALLRDLAAAMTKRPDKINVECHSSVEGTVFWEMTCAPEDRGKLIGARGSHARAFAFLVAKMGAAEGERWEFKLETERGESVSEPPVARPKWHDPKPAHELLDRALAELPLRQFAVEAPRPDESDPLFFHFDIRVPDKGDRYALIGQERHGDASQSVLNALGTLFRAMGRKLGVAYQINVV
jgi:predicted RNA-binding protein YlqC (UPF0109 family)